MPSFVLYTCALNTSQAKCECRVLCKNITAVAFCDSMSHVIQVQKRPEKPGLKLHDEDNGTGAVEQRKFDKECPYRGTLAISVKAVKAEEMPVV